MNYNKCLYNCPVLLGVFSNAYEVVYGYTHERFLFCPVQYVDIFENPLGYENFPNINYLNCCTTMAGHAIT